MRMLAQLGFADVDEVAEMWVGVRDIRVDVFASDENGHRYVNSDGEAARHHISIPVIRGPQDRAARQTWHRTDQPKGETP